MYSDINILILIYSDIIILITFISLKFEPTVVSTETSKPFPFRISPDARSAKQAQSCLFTSLRSQTAFKKDEFSMSAFVRARNRAFRIRPEQAE